MIRRPPRSTLSSSSAASDVYKRQIIQGVLQAGGPSAAIHRRGLFSSARRRKRYTRSMYPSFGVPSHRAKWPRGCIGAKGGLHILHSTVQGHTTVSYTHLRAHETPEHLVCRLLLEKKKKKKICHSSIL
eukprot:TRINITY_DN7525_c0_g1_i4.p1 TRINITY_DN7525_c0_g1~~TRINITY_DN7525_c0_g1_i4.p1  ORF type:complete len:129 (+),score=18.15 TRINITY_DN7525_c0_g1_i4:134-520(+)